MSSETGGEEEGKLGRKGTSILARDEEKKELIVKGRGKGGPLTSPERGGVRLRMMAERGVSFRGRRRIPIICLLSAVRQRTPGKSAIEKSQEKKAHGLNYLSLQDAKGKKTWRISTIRLPSTKRGKNT